MKNLLKEKDAVSCKTQEEREMVINIALKLGVKVFEDTINEKRDNDYPYLVFEGCRIIGFKSGFYSGYKYHTALQFISKMVGVDNEKDLKIANLEYRLSVIQAEIAQLKAAD